MKKLMTMIAAVATAFGLYAADTGTSFEGVNVTEPLALADEVGNITELMTGGSYWGEIPADATINLYNDDKYKSARPSPFGEEPYTAQFNYLKLSSASTELTRYAQAKDGEKAVPVNVKNLTKGEYFFDSLVKLTAFDSKPDATGAKIALWLKDGPEWEGETTATTNLMVTVGSTDYDCGDASSLVDAWKRVTIKAMMVNANDMGFVIFVEQAPVAFSGDKISTDGLSPAAKYYADKNQLFLITASDTEITSVGFKGMGSVDDLVFTETVPTFAADVLQYTVTWDPAKVGTVTFDPAAQATNGTTVTFMSQSLPPSVKMSWTANAEYAAGEKTLTPSAGGSYTLTDGDYSEGVAKVNEIAYATIAKAIEEAAGTANAVVLLKPITEAIQVSANVTLDLNGQQIGAKLSTATDVQIVLTNSAETDAIVNGDATDAKGTINVTSIKFDYNNNSVPPPSEGCGLQLEPTGAVADYEFVRGTGADSIYWVLKEPPKSYNLTVVKPANGSVSTFPAAPIKVKSGEEVTVFAEASVGYSVEKITMNDTTVIDNKFVMPEADAEVTAVITANVYKVTFDTNGGTAFADQEYTFGEGNFKLNTYEGTKPGFKFSGWTTGAVGAEIIENGAELAKIVGGYALTAVWEAEATRPPVIPEAQKEAYDTWANQNNFAKGQTDDIYADYFAIGLTDAEVEEAGGNAAKAASDKLAAMITADMVKALAAGNAAEFGTLPTDYPNAQFTFVKTNEIPSEDGVSGFYRLHAAFKPANKE